LPWLRAGLLLFCVAVVGALVGTGWESTLPPEENLEADSLAGLPTSPYWYSGPSEANRQVVQRATAELPPYKDAVPQALEADYLGPNSRIAVAWFMTHDTPDQVLGFYRQALLEMGIPVLAHRYNANAGYVGHMDPSTKETHLVSVLAQGGQTWVFVSSGGATSLLQAPEQLPKELPLPEGVQEPVVLAFRQEGNTRYSVQADVPQGRAEELAAFYRTTFGAQGWTLESGEEQEAGGMHMLASRGRDRISALVQPRGDGAQLLLTLDKQERAQ
jgi:hypothetical protein